MPPENQTRVVRNPHGIVPVSILSKLEKNQFTGKIRCAELVLKRTITH